MKILSICVVVACLAWHACADDAAEPRSAPARGLLKRGLLTKGKPTTTTTTPAPQESDYVDEEEYPNEEVETQAQDEPTSEAPSSTEGKRLVGGGVRPFRSNSDLLETLKRRRAEAAGAKHNVQQPTPAAPQEPANEAPAKQPSNTNGKKRFSSPSRGEAAAASEDTAAPTQPKPSKNRFSRPSSRSIQPEPEAEEQINDTAPARSARTFSRRGGN